MADPLQSISVLMLPRETTDDDLIRYAASVSTSITILNLFIWTLRHVTRRGMEAFLNVLASRISIKTISLQSTDISSGVVNSLAFALRHQTINVSKIFVLWKQLSDWDVILTLVDALRENQIVIKLQLQGNESYHLPYLESQEQEQRIGQTFRLLLHDNKKLSKLAINSMHFGTDLIITELATGLRHNSTLEILCLAYTDIGNFGAIALAEALSYNQSLRTLQLEQNRIGADGMIALANVIQSNNFNNNNKSLQRLYVGFNFITKAVIDKWADVLKDNSSLVEFSCENRILSNWDMLPLLEAMKSNTTIEILDIFSAKPSTDMEGRLTEVMQYNDTIHEMCNTGETVMKEYLIGNKNGTRVAPKKREQKRQKDIMKWLMRIWINEMAV